MATGSRRTMYPSRTSRLRARDGRECSRLSEASSELCLGSSVRHHDSWRNGRLVAVQGACQVERELECHYRITKGRRSRNGAASRTCHGVRKRRLYHRASPSLETRAVGAERFLSRGSLVAFSGVDGSGKSTQIGLLQE